MSMVLGNALDLVGTYIAQPHFEYEANPLFRFLLAHGVYTGWPGAILGKTIFCLFFTWAVLKFRDKRRIFYPKPGLDFREFITTFIYGRVLTWAETFYRWPKRLQSSLLSIGAIVSLSGPYSGWLGYENIASQWGLWHPKDYSIGSIWIDPLLFPYVLAVMAWFILLLWNDYQSISS